MAWGLGSCSSRMWSEMEDGLDNYRKLIDRVEDRCRSIQDAHADQLRCRPGCASCCLSISIFPVEASHILQWIRETRDPFFTESGREFRFRSGICPMLHENICRIYPVRPLICRTHGYPMLTRESGEAVVSCCPMNFTEVSVIPSSALIDLDLLTRTLVAVNRVFLETGMETARWSADRISLEDIFRAAV